MDFSNTQKQISKLGLGCVTFGREIDEKRSFELMDYAYHNGINLFDTAAAYGAGASEQIVGKWFNGKSTLRSSIIVATKILPPYNHSQINAFVEESLKRLNTEVIDILYLHRWDNSLNEREAWETLYQLITEGKIKELGVSNFNAEQLAFSLDMQEKLNAKRISHIQNNQNLAVTDVSEGIKAICIHNDIKIITFSPLGAGFLTGKHIHGVQKGSRFSDMPAHQDIYFNEHSNQQLDKLLKLAEHTGYSPIHLALSWAIHQKGIASVLVGGRSIDHLKQAILASQFEWTKEFSQLFK